MVPLGQKEQIVSSLLFADAERRMPSWALKHQDIV